MKRQNQSPLDEKKKRLRTPKSEKFSIVGKHLQIKPNLRTYKIDMANSPLMKPTVASCLKKTSKSDKYERELEKRTPNRNQMALIPMTPDRTGRRRRDHSP